jgi:hypothetical protein
MKNHFACRSTAPLVVLFLALCFQASSAIARPDADPAPKETASNGPGTGVTELEWDTLIPEDWSPEKLMDEYNADELNDNDPRAQELMEKLQELWREAPVVTELDGKHVKLPGFVVPLEMDEESIGEFLLVPYYGACIHVPPPPANQTVHVVTAKGHAYQGQLFDTVWVTGELKVEHSTSDLAEAGYRIQGATVEPYEE